ncbi:neprilysin-3-like [Leptopilina heterotoma]|uniref:neprilysin-3-like n=1 Tax=Leptopilina heterotoma TaxID=63436 RepID=UPI001CAA219D|nr:neprilysin-3-like [Leptopilina heterotoma]
MIWRNVYCLLQMLSALTVVTSFNRFPNLLSEMMVVAMSDVAHPCNDFYKYVCDNWTRNFPRPNYYPVWSPEELTMDYLIDKIREVLESPNVDHNYFHVYKEKQFYDSCMDTDISVTEGRRLYSQIKSESEQARPHWQNVAEYYASKIGEVSLFHITLNSENQLVITKPVNTEVNKLLSGKLGRSLLVDYLNNNKQNLIYHRHPESDWNFEEEFYNFLSDLKELLTNPKSLLITVSIQELQEMYDNNCSSLGSSVSKIEWHRLLQKLSEPDINLEPSFQLLIDFEYVKGLCALLSDTQDDVIVRYLQFNFQMSYETLFHLNIFNSATGEEMTPLERSVKCITMIPITTGFYEILADSDEFYEREEFLNDLVERIKYELKLEIRNSWMDVLSKRKALKVVTDLSLHISKLNFPTLRKEISTTSYGFDVTTVSLLNWINFKKAQMVYKFELSLIHSQTKRRRKRHLIMNAFYEPNKHRILISPVMLFPPLFSLNAPIAYNFGRLGVTIGHEISHAFDYHRLDPKFGYTFQSNPYLNSTFQEKLKCVSDQYISLMVPTSTLVENMADIQGIKLAYKAMQRYFRDHPEAVRRNGFQHFEHFDNNKIFFVSFANKFCETRELPMPVTTHSPNDMRVIGSLLNMKEFGESFACPENTLMNPTKICDFWEPTYNPNMNLCSNFNCLRVK